MLRLMIPSRLLTLRPASPPTNEPRVSWLARFPALLFASIGLVLCVTACTEVGDPALVLETSFEVPTGPLSFTEHIEPILLDSGCQGCHGSGGGFGGLDTTSAAALRAGGDAGPAVVPCDSEDSYLWQRVRDCEMPASGACLDEAEVATIARWIDQGAQEGFDPSICPDTPVD